MKTYRLKMIQEYIESYDIKANSENEAVQNFYNAGDLQPDDTKAGDSKVKSIEVIS
jgi:competence protein ComGC|tara:strand:+ start:30 stop:197 length:168 start_codon:yes stop_codon:yes gene_type:complete